MMHVSTPHSTQATGGGERLYDNPRMIAQTLNAAQTSKSRSMVRPRHVADLCVHVC